MCVCVCVFVCVRARALRGSSLIPISLVGETKKMNLVEAIRSGLDIALQTDPTAGALCGFKINQVF